MTSSDFADTVDLLRRAKTGENKCLHAVLVRYRARLLDRIRLMMGDPARRCADSDDFLQSVFVAILEDFGRFEPRDDAAFLRWATQIARNRIRQSVRRRHETALASLTAESVELTRSADGTPADEVARQEQIERLVDALAELPDEQQRAIELRHFEGLSFAEVGERLGRSENAAQLLHARALLRLGRLVRLGK